MNFVQQLLEAFTSLAANKLRTGLTMLGIVIGVAAVISMLAIGKGAQASIDSQINSIGSNLIYVIAGADGVKNIRPLTLSDATAIGDPDQAPSVSQAAAAIQDRYDVSSNGESKATTVIGVTPDYGDLTNLVLTEGEFITDSNMSSLAAVAILGPDTAKRLFDTTEGLLGESIRINGQVFKVGGILKSKGGGGFGSQDDRVIIPLTTGQARLFNRPNAGQVDQIIVQANSSDLVNQAGDEISQILQMRHQSPVGVMDFTVIKQQDMLTMATSITSVFTIFLGGIGGISLLVGGIGIMNIMLVSVTERTREIGLRKAIGARRRDILAQFLLESATLSLIGGVIGIGLAWLIGRGIALIAANAGSPFQPVIGWDAVILATLFSTCVGLFFGIYPANRAASLEPVEALRSE
jgi:putative ABC transport system permease protein